MSDRESVGGVRGGWPVRLGDVLAPALERLGPKTLWTESKIRKIWPAVVGDAVAPHARIRRLQGSSLLVDTTSDTWATELRYLSRVVIEKITERLGDGVVTEIVVSRARERRQR